MKIAEVSNQQLGEQLSRLCTLGDIGYPSDPKMLADFLKNSLKAYDYEFFCRALDNWLQGHSEIYKPQQLNAQFVSRVLNEYRPFYRGFTPQEVQSISQEEKTALYSNSLRLLYGEYLNHLELDSHPFVLKQVETLYDYVVATKPYRPTKEELIKTTRWCEEYARGLAKVIHSTSKNAHRKFLFSLESKKALLDFEKCAHVVCYFNHLISKQVKP